MSKKEIELREDGFGILLIFGLDRLKLDGLENARDSDGRVFPREPIASVIGTVEENTNSLAVHEDHYDLVAGMDPKPNAFLKAGRIRIINGEPVDNKYHEVELYYLRR